MPGRNGSDRTARLQNIKPFFVKRHEGAGIALITTCDGPASNDAANNVIVGAETAEQHRGMVAASGSAACPIGRGVLRVMAPKRSRARRDRKCCRAKQNPAVERRGLCCNSIFVTERGCMTPVQALRDHPV